MPVTRGAPGRLALIVLGSHRSGTSATARVLSLAGAALPARLMAPVPGNNPTGFWEPQDIAELDDRLLGRLDSGWDDLFGPRRADEGLSSDAEALEEAQAVVAANYGDAGLIVLKEPRIALLADFWKTALRAQGYQLAFVIPVRNPLEVAASLKARDGFTRNRGLLLWTSYMLATERATRGERRVFISFDSLLADPEAALDRVERKLAFRFPRRTWESATEIEEFLRADLKTEAKLPLSTLSGPLDPVRKLYEHLQAAAEDAPENEDVTAEVADWFGALEQTLAPVLKQVERDARRALQAQQSRIDEAQTAGAGKAQEVEAVRAELAAAQGRADGLEQQIAHEREHVRQAEEQLRAELRTRVEEAGAGREAEVAAARSELEALRTHVEALEAQLAQERDLAGRAQQQLRDELLGRLAEAEAEGVEHRAEAEALRIELAPLRGQAEPLERARDEALRHAEALEAQVASMRADAEAAAVRLRQVDDESLARVGELQAALDAAGAELAAAQAARDQEAERAAQATEALAAETERRHGQQEVWEEELRAANADSAAAAARAAEALDRIASLEAELARIRAEVQVREASVGEELLQAQAAELAAAERLDAESARTAELTAELARAQEVGNAASSRLVTLVEELDRARQAERDASDHAAAVAIELAGTRRAAEAGLAEERALASTLREERDEEQAARLRADAQAEALRSRLADVEAGLSGAHDALVRSGDEKAVLEEGLAQAQAALAAANVEHERRLVEVEAVAASARAEAAQAERARDEAVRTADDRSTVVESALRIARRRAAESEELLQQRITAAESGARDARRALAAATETLQTEKSAWARDTQIQREAHAVELRTRAEEARRGLDEERRRYADEDSALRDRLAETGVVAATAQTRVRELQQRLADTEAELERRRSWVSRLFGLR